MSFESWETKLARLFFTAREQLLRSMPNFVSKLSKTMVHTVSPKCFACRGNQLAHFFFLVSRIIRESQYFISFFAESFPPRPNT